jgi:hypothetical protein
VLTVDCTANGGADGECRLGVPSQRSVLHAGSRLIVASGALRIVATAHLFGSLTILSGLIPLARSFCCFSVSFD